MTSARFVPQSLTALAAALTLGACAARTTAETVTNVRLAGAVQPVAQGDCREAVRRAVAEPDLAVDVLPSPVRMQPAPLQKVPKGALRKDGSATIRVRVVVDTLGKADMRTFVVDSASHPWFVSNVKTVMPRWTFSPAMLAGCKVPRVYLFMASTPARTAQPAARRATRRGS
jgi:hypothetical protein